ncbi:MAG: hypothetical protein MMC33_003199 [Icmadophila ericetorum]|nr:hypothetical protein [Icmadophila ericetorum]
MDPASCAVAFIQFSVGTAQAIKQLHDFVQDVKDAPKNVKKLVDELVLLGRIIEEVRNGGGNVDIPASTLESFNAAEQLVHGCAEQLSAKLVRKLPDALDTRTKRLWKNLKVAMSKEDIQKHFVVLERAKSSLLIAQAEMHHQKTHRQLQSLSEDQKLISSASVSRPVVIQYISQTVSIDNSVSYGSNRNDTPNRQSEQEVELYPDSKDLGTKFRKLVSNKNLAPKQAQLLKFYLGKALEYVAEQDRQIDREVKVHSQKEPFRPEYMTMLSPKNPKVGLHLLDVSRRHLSEYSFSSSSPVRTAMVYDHPWVGKIVVRRRTKYAKQWNIKDGTFERLREEQTTTLELSLAPWLSMPYSSIEVQMQRLQFMHEAPRNALKLPALFPYIQMPEELENAIQAGNLSALQKAVSQNVIHLGGRDQEGRNLLDMSLEAFGDDYKNTISDPPSHIGSLLEMARWFHAHGVRTEMSDNHFILANHMYLSVYNSDGDTAANTFNMEQLLIDVTADAPAIPRAKTLLHFAIINTEHTVYLESVISDIIDDAVSVDEHHCAEDLTKLENELVDIKARWTPIISESNEEDLYLLGAEYVILLSWIRLKRLSQFTRDGTNISAERFNCLKGPRYVLLKSLLTYAEPYLSDSDVFEGIANWLKICRRCTPTILEDGFGDFLSQIACRNNQLGMWHELLDLAGYSGAEFISRHIAMDHNLIQKPLRIQLAQAVDLDPSNPSSIVLTVKDPHELGAMRAWEQIRKPQERFVINSHETLLSPEICVMRQVGSELFFDCGITDPTFDNGTDWELEQEYFEGYEEKMEYYTEEDVFVEMAERDEDKQTSHVEGKPRSLLSNLVSRSALALSSIV